MSRRDPFDVVVVGAGIVGSAAALAFARDGLRVALVEPHAPLPWRADAPDLRVYALAQDNIDLFDALGVWHGIAPQAQPYRTMRVWDAAGGGKLRFDAQRYGRDALGWIAEHALVADRLWNALQQAGVALRCPQRVVAIESGEGADDADRERRGSVALRLDDQAVLRARLVVAADGSESKLRELAGIGVARRDYGQRGLVAFVETAQPHRDTAWQRFLPTGPIAFLPFRDGRSSIVWTLPDAEAARLLAIDDAGFCRELTRAFDATPGDVVAVSQRAAFPLRRQIAERFVEGRIALCGDAAHVVHPLAGQGLNMGLRDVIALRASVRGASERGGDIGAPHRLARWQRERRSESSVAAFAFDGINRLFSNDAPLPTLARGHLLGLAGKIPGLDALLWKRAAGL
ncbi:MAG TPA: FAD-dependent oxidoreductase [Xanthomonadaceae bacterium]|jgi:2-octaprenyl-3-methyl-6-methoxy-1,4-benzoquinol hydroxylase|nr:FAD-dependent oxidoreductase [Xanthomonadaceae bacterium]